MKQRVFKTSRLCPVTQISTTAHAPSNLIAQRLRTTAPHTPPALLPSIPLDTRHLGCETQVAQFKLRRVTPRTETLCKRTDKGLAIDTELTIPEAEVLNAAGAVVGRVIPTDQRRGLASGLYDSILLSESQY
jgi:hypothetical protein